MDQRMLSLIPGFYSPKLKSENTPKLPLIWATTEHAREETLRWRHAQKPNQLRQIRRRTRGVIHAEMKSLRTTGTDASHAVRQTRVLQTKFIVICVSFPFIWEGIMILWIPMDTSQRCVETIVTWAKNIAKNVEFYSASSAWTSTVVIRDESTVFLYIAWIVKSRGAIADERRRKKLHPVRGSKSSKPFKNVVRLLHVNFVKSHW